MVDERSHHVWDGLNLGAMGRSPVPETSHVPAGTPVRFFPCSSQAYPNCAIAVQPFELHLTSGYSGDRWQLQKAMSDGQRPLYSGLLRSQRGPADAWYLGSTMPLGEPMEHQAQSAHDDGLKLAVCAQVNALAPRQGSGWKRSAEN